MARGRHLVLKLLVTLVSSVSALIEDSPRNLTVFLDTSQTVNFTCVTGVATDVSLTVLDSNGSLVHEESAGDLTFYQGMETDSSGGVWSVHGVRIAVKLAYNASIIHCQARLEGREVDTANGLLLMQGPPGAVSGMRVVANESHVVVSWRAPFTLDVTGVEFYLTFSLLISNVTDESPADIVCEACHNLTLPSFVFSPLHPLPGHSFNFTVTALNGAGTGPPSHTLTATLPYGTSHLYSPMPPATGPGNKDDGSSPVAAITAGTLLAVIITLALFSLIAFLCYCVLISRLCPKLTSHTRLGTETELSEQQTSEQGGGCEVRERGRESGSSDGDLSPGEVRKRHSHGSHSPESSEQ